MANSYNAMRTRTATFSRLARRIRRRLGVAHERCSKILVDEGEEPTRYYECSWSPAATFRQLDYVRLHYPRAFFELCAKAYIDLINTLPCDRDTDRWDSINSGFSDFEHTVETQQLLYDLGAESHEDEDWSNYQHAEYDLFLLLLTGLSRQLRSVMTKLMKYIQDRTIGDSWGRVSAFVRIHRLLRDWHLIKTSTSQINALFPQHVARDPASIGSVPHPILKVPKEISNLIVDELLFLKGIPDGLQRDMRTAVKAAKRGQQHLGHYAIEQVLEGPYCAQCVENACSSPARVCFRLSQ